jgi:hypothetical protein
MCGIGPAGRMRRANVITSFDSWKIRAEKFGQLTMYKEQWSGEQATIDNSQLIVAFDLTPVNRSKHYFCR